jgi:hypothetical protein
MSRRLICRARARPAYEDGRGLACHSPVKGSKRDSNARSCGSRDNNDPVSRLPVRMRTYELMQDRSEMSQEESEERPTPPVPIGHKYEIPIVEELPRETPDPAREDSDAAKRSSSENKNRVDS